MSAEIAATRAAVTEALGYADSALNFTNQLPPLCEAAFDANIGTHSSLEAVASGLSRFLQKSSLAEGGSALAAQILESEHGTLATADLQLTSAYQNWESAIEAGQETVLELECALTSFTTIASKTKDMQTRFDGEAGIRELLKKAARTAESALVYNPSPGSHNFSAQLKEGVSYAMLLSSELRVCIETVGFGEKFLPGITERLKEAVMILLDSKDVSVFEFTAALKAAQNKISQEDLAEVVQLVDDTSELKNSYAFFIPRQQHNLRQNIQNAIQLGEQLQDTV